MTREEIMAMRAGPEMDAAVHAAVFGVSDSVTDATPKRLALELWHDRLLGVPGSAKLWYGGIDKLHTHVYRRLRELDWGTVGDLRQQLKDRKPIRGLGKKGRALVLRELLPASTPKYSADDAAALEVLKAFERATQIVKNADSWTCWILGTEETEDEPTFALAVCRAALLAKL